MALTLMATACASSVERPGAKVGEQIESSAKESVPSALDDPTQKGLPAPLIDVSLLIAGGPPPDGIPPIDAPSFEEVADVDWLSERDPVIALEIDGDARAYPTSILTWHEIVNDTLAGIPVTVSYCPLCNSAIAFDRRLGERIIDLGTSGKVYNSALVMYDRQTESLWSHFTGQAIAGFLTGQELETIPVSTVSWSDFSEAHPKGSVLSIDTGFARDYGRNPYVGYDEADDDPFLFSGETDGRLPPKTRIVGIRGRGSSVAVVTSTLARDRVAYTELNGERVVVFFVPGTASALDSSKIAEGKDVGASGVFVARAAGMQLAFESVGGGFRDAQTSTTWNILGSAIDGPLKGRQLRAVEHVDTFWFAWAAFQPDTKIIR